MPPEAGEPFIPLLQMAISPIALISGVGLLLLSVLLFLEDVRLALRALWIEVGGG
ncbi:MAG TPA: hypothetical protein VMT16_07170 [Thermoanaerobaculia bacterium]|nr:hypothetical protein [Thermoanaerobaculia bacterium]